MTIDHLFICSSQQGQEAEQFVQLGWQDGSSRIHPGQGTVNRKFYFENGFLELLWIDDLEELQNGPAATIGLQERFHWQTEEVSRFGLCLAPSPELDLLFAKANTYRPDYFSPGKIINYFHFPKLPWVFKLPFPPKFNPQEPLQDALGIQELTKVIFEIPDLNGSEPLLRHLNQQKSLVFRDGSTTALIMEFDDQRQDQEQNFPDLDLRIRY
ncbi:VOC family protein [Croceiramulus getboli]|nr:VOC family protein [Flavobacteriaceae bacterium YJPT1-3]